MNNYLVFDWGGTLIKYALMDENAQIIQKDSVPSPKKTDTKEIFIKVIDAIVNQYKDNIKGIAISSPGILNSKEGIIHIIGAFPYLRETNIKKEFEERYNLPCTIENDAKCAALAELWQGSLKGIQDGAVWIIGTSIGGGIILDGKLRRGKDFSAGEFSGMFTDIYHPTDLNSYCAQLGAHGLCERVVAHCHINHEINGHEAFNLINASNPDALAALEEYTDLTARVLFNLNLLLDLEKICIGGGISEQPLLMQYLHTSIQKLSTYHHDILEGTSLPLPQIDTCHFYNDANLIGALYHMLKES